MTLKSKDDVEHAVTACLLAARRALTEEEIFDSICYIEGTGRQAWRFQDYADIKDVLARLGATSKTNPRTGEVLWQLG